VNEVKVSTVFGDDWERELEEPGFRIRSSRVAAALGAQLLGASVYEIEPGQRGMPYHVHHANEELLLLLRGSVSVRTPEGEVILKQGDLMVFRRGRAGAHQVVNRSGEVARYLVVSTRVFPEVAEFPDTGKIFVQAGPGADELAMILDSKAEREWLEGEPTEAVHEESV
jgi:uncharacterized cupin superfamily protein